MAAAEITREFGPHPLTIIGEAMSAAQLAGIRVRIGSHGVEFASWSGRWIRDPNEDGVDPIGAAILHRQPQVSDIDEAAAAAVNAPFAWAVGCSDGIARRQPADAWARSIKAAFYEAGYEAGVWLRVGLLLRDRQNMSPTPPTGKV